MCGRINVIDDPFVKGLMKLLGMSIYPKPKNNIGPGSLTDILIQQDNERLLVEALWSLLIEQKEDGYGYRPNPKGHTFNSKSSRLTSSPLWSSAFKTHRASAIPDSPILL